ncbi:ABC transporter [Secundilactobacillus oryzae JCM 18671]|uniref:ABC transporter n=1 Tax=Secundilactobacillus oryzae JCM 18671 TaxID=1291743 RepID=A0A081BJN4_9LACO|nr:ABC transporter ATP-binding protein [Secundilactobacillus oryzae]GAK48252.1 ABC transporter [Secundilactobacillus oryzae JCM 18671]
MSVLTVDHLTKSYSRFTLDPVSFNLEAGKIYGLIGSNGAGKSTLLKSILGLVIADSGEVEAFDQPLVEMKSRIGVVLGGIDTYMDKRLSTLTVVTKRFYSNWNQQRFDDLCSRFSLDLSKKPRELSTGMKVKYQLAVAFAHQAELLVLDEPTAGLDLVAHRDLQKQLRRLADEGVTILLATHLVDDLEQCADELLVLSHGTLQAQMSLAEFIATHQTPATPTLTEMLLAMEENDVA